VALKLDQVVEGVGVTELTGVDQAHEQIADMSAVLGFIKESVLAMKDGFLQGSLANIMPTTGLCRIR
jgi:hypothetical protein